MGKAHNCKGKEKYIRVSILYSFVVDYILCDEIDVYAGYFFQYCAVLEDH